MCGIAGILQRDGAAPVMEESLRAMAGAISHRGPDSEGIWTAPGVGLAHRRLSIIDLAGGHQPIANEDGSVQIVFNGEIYNYRELQKELERQGHRFRTSSDTEVIVHLYEELGERVVERLRGMFAFAIWDTKRNRLLLARDRVGIKPLYYYHDGNRLLFGSEIKAILACAGLNLDIDVQSLDDYLTFGVIPGERSIYQQIRKLPPATTLSIGGDDWNASPRCYWKLNVEPDESKTVEDWLETLDGKLRETVAAHQISDVPVGAFLSGGLDSSAIVGVATEVSGRKLQTFSVGFDEEKFSELPYARQVAERFGTAHVEEIVRPKAAESLQDLVHFYDEPFADSSAIPTMAVSRVARESVKVVLSGDGGDEAFGGYARYVHDLWEGRLRARIPAVVRRTLIRGAARLWPKADWLPRPLRAKTTLTNLSLDGAAAYANTISICRRDLRRRILNGDALSAINGYRPEDRIIESYRGDHPDALKGMISADVSMLLPDDFLTKVDRASMAVGLEVRPPLLDHEFLEVAGRVPSEFKVRNGESKWIFKQLCGKWLTEETIYRKKQGFEIPVDLWLRGPLRESFEDQVLSPGNRVSEFLDQRVIRGLYDAHRRGTGRHGQVLWSLLVLGTWMERYKSYAGQAV